MLGRLAWPSLLDAIGPKKVYNILVSIATPLYISIPFIINYSIANPGVLGLYGFIVSTTIIISIMGGTYATIPAYEANIFGKYYDFEIL